MSIHIFARQRPWLSVLVLLALFATLLPPQRASADLTFPLTKAETDALFIRWYEAQLPKKGKDLLVETTIAANIIVSVNLPTTKMTDELNALNRRFYKLLGPRGADPQYRKSLPLITLSRAMYDAGAQSPVLREATLQAHRRLKQHAADLKATYWASIRPKNRAVYETIAKDGAMSEAYRTLLDEMIEKGAKRAKTDKQFGQTLDAVLGPLTGITLSDFDARTFLAEHGNILPQAIRDMVQPDGSMQVSPAALKTVAKSEFATFNSAIDDIQKTTAEISREEVELADFMNDPEARQKAQAIAEAKVLRYQNDLQAASSTLSIVSTLISFQDPKLGMQVSVVGNSMLQISDSLVGWMEATAGLNGLDKLGSLSTVVMTGNVCSAR